MSTKNQITEIENQYQFNTDGFSAVDRLGSFVVNRKFSEGYRQMKNGENSRGAYVWNVLSAIGDDIGNVLYSNIANYIDFVSNIDLCKTRALRSMLKQIGIQYPVFDQLVNLPIELQNVIDILSVNRRYICDNKIVRDELVAALRSSGSITNILSELKHAQEQVLKLNASIASESVKSINGDVFDDDKYRSFISDSYKNLLSCFLDLEYNMDPARDDDGVLCAYYIRKSSSFLDQYRKQNSPILQQSSYDEFLTFKEENGISPSFDQDSIVDDIEQGIDSLDNYTGYERELLNLEISRRAGVLKKTDIIGQLNGLVDSDGDIVLRKTRYSYYRRAKVLEYANFIDNKFFSDIKGTNNEEYGYDPSYFNVGDEDVRGVITEDGEINQEVLDHVAEYLVNITFYIQKLREKFKLQTRKYYMRGTNLLLRYVINEYLVDYSRTNLLNDDTNQYLRSLSSHNIDNIDIVEYFDQTEYYNLSTDYTKFSENEGEVNKRFWNDIVQNEGDVDIANAFTTRQIEEFYLNTMLDGNKNINISNFYDFLDAMYGLGANSSFIDRETGIFQSTLSSGEHVHDIYPRLVELSSALSVINTRYLSSDDFKYDTETDLSTQISNTVNEYIYNNLSAVYYDGVYDLFNEINPKIVDLSNSFENTKASYENLITGNYIVYFDKSDVEYCYVDNDPENDYKHDGKHDLGDYYIDNPTYEYSRFRDKLDGLRSFVSDGRNMRNYPILDTLDYVTTNFVSISSELADEVISEIDDYGFVDTHTPSLKNQIQNVYDFLDKKIEDRLEYLTQLINALKDQANQALQAYDAANNSFNQAIATYSDNNESYTLGDSTIYCVSVNKPSGDEAKEDYNKDKGNVCQAKKDRPTSPYDFIKYCSINGYWYYGNKKGSGSYGYDEVHLTPYSPNDPLEARCSEVQDYINAPTAFSFVYDADGSYSIEYFYELMSEGTQAAIDTTIQAIGNVRAQHDSVVNQLENLGISYPNSTTGDIHSDILNLIEFLTTTLDESFLGNDKLILKYKELLEQVLLLSSDYSTINDAYERMFQDSKQVWYFNDYVRTLNPTLKELLKLSAYCDGRDIVNQQTITRELDDLYNTYNSHLDTFNGIANELSVIDYRVPTSPLEDQLEDISKTLQADLDMRLYNAKTSLEDEIQDEVKPRFDIIEKNLSNILGERYDLGEKAQEKVTELNFFINPQYIKSKELFSRYTGILGVSDQVAFNHKNKTHPSYQVHPFLWSFVEREDSMINTLSKSINSIYPSITPELLTGFIGEFGQVINVWKTDSQFFDTTGYASRYEVSQNQPKNVDLKSNEVVDYDGAFYPPAVEMLRQDFDKCVSQLRRRDGEFYRRFFSHLGLNDVELERECQQLLDYYPLIKDITDDHDLPRVYDIYKYSLDENGNSFILYKQYGKREPSYKEMRNTPGELWIRLAEHPFAFPAFTGLSSQVVDVSESTNGAIRKYLDADNGVTIRCDVDNPSGTYSISTRNVKRMQWFYDLHFTRNKQNIALIGVNLDKSSGRDATYDNAWVIYSQLEYTGEDSVLETYAKIGFPTTNSVGERTTDYVACGSNMLSTDNDEINLVGIYQKGINEIWSVYIENPMFNGKDPRLTLWRSVNSQAQAYVNGETIANLEYPSMSSDWCVSYNSKDNMLTFAYIASLDDDKFDSGYTHGVNYQNAEGAVIDDPEKTEMNSHDILDGRVVTFDLRLKERHVQADRSGMYSYNINADMSYSPLYPGKEHQSDISNDKKDIYALELLGESKNIDHDIGLVNTRVNPYFDYNNMYDDGAFGRVYESYLSAEDKTLKVVRNRSMFKNFPTGTKQSEFETYSFVNNPGEFVWSISLGDINFVDKKTTREHKTENKYTDKDYQSLQVLIYNRNTLGKNPYFIGSLSGLSISGETTCVIPIMYSDETEDNEQLISSDVFTNGKYCSYSETYNLSNSLNNVGNNRIRGINSISATYDVNEKKIELRFSIEDGKQEFTHIPSDTIEVLLYNPYDLTMFEKYHMLDAYGLIKDIRLKDTIKNNVIGDGWQIVYDDYMKYSKEELDKSRPYYLDDHGIKNFLLNLELSDYSHLSDVYVFDTEKRLGFKYDEELRFDLSNDAYYYPSLNRKYPKSRAHRVSTDMFSSTNTNDLSYVKNIFGDRNLFIFNLDDGNDIADDIGTIDMDVDGGQLDECRVFEDYYDDENYLKYDDDDPQSLQFVHCQEIDDDNSKISEITEWDYIGMTTDVFIDHMNEKYGIDICGIKSELTPDVFSGSDVSFDVDSNNINLDNSCKLYVNYKKTDKKQIVLYFNYFNYLETPYVIYRDGLVYPDIVDNTYLKLNPGESGVLDVVVQFRYYYGNRLCGVKNIKTLSYMVYNVSDDKPKFVIKKVYQISKDEYRRKDAQVDVLIQCGNINIDTQVVTPEESVKPSNRNLDIYLQKSGELSSDMEFFINYPYQIFEIKVGSFDGYSVDTATSGYAHVKVTRRSLNRISLDVVVNPVVEILDYQNNNFMIGVETSELFGSNGLVANITTVDGSVSIGSFTMQTTLLGAVKPGTNDIKIAQIETNAAIGLSN